MFTLKNPQILGYKKDRIQTTEISTKNLPSLNITSTDILGARLPALWVLLHWHRRELFTLMHRANEKEMSDYFV